MVTHSVSRRNLLIGAGTAAVAGATGLSGCGTLDATTKASGSTSKPPTYVPFPGPAPNLPSSPDGVPPAYYSYPAKPASYAAVPISASDPISVFTLSNGLGTPKENSQWWQNLQDILKIDLSLILANNAGFAAKQAVQLASGDVPDIMIVNPYNVPLGALNKHFTDLTEFLSGDAVKDYPGLAAIPTLSWKASTINGTLWGVPQPRFAVGYSLGINPDTAATKGITDFSLSEGQDLLDLMKDLTDSKRNRWAFGQSPLWMVRLLWEMFGVPNGANGWSQNEGKFTSQLENEATPDVLAAVSGMWRAGVMHPDSASPALGWFPGGVVDMYIQEFSQFAPLLVANPGLGIEMIPLPKWHGGGLATKQMLSPAASGNYAAFKKASPDRIRELLRLADYLAAPVGTVEFLNVNYGLAGGSYTLDGSDPIPTEQGQGDYYTIQSLGYVTSGALNVLYTPGHEDFVKHQHDYAVKVMKSTHFNPAVGLYSPTLVSPAGVSAAKNIQSVMDDIMVDRKPVSAWSDAVKTWRSAAGDKIRGEYQEAYAKLNG